MEKLKIAVFLSGAGSSAVALCRYFKNHPFIEVALIITTNEGSSGYLELQRSGYRCMYVDKEKANSKVYLVDLCQSIGITYIILAGYLRLIPKEMVRAYQERIINIHPSLLPKYGGAGMYGEHVHRAVLDGLESRSGISVHYVDENFDTGRLIAQFYCDVDPKDGLAELKAKIKRLEHAYFPVVIEQTILENLPCPL